MHDIITDMPGWNIHLEAGTRLADKLEFSQQERKEFLFGCLLPDINNGYINQVKIKKHHYETHYAFDQKSSLNFYAENKTAVDEKEPIFLGYLFHLYADGYFNYNFFHNIKSSKRWSSLSHDAKQDIKHHDFWVYDSKYHHHLGVQSPSDLRRLANLANTIDAAEIAPEDIIDVERIMENELSSSLPDRSYRFYTEEDLENLTDSTIHNFSRDYLGAIDA